MPNAAEMIRRQKRIERPEPDPATVRPAAGGSGSGGGGGIITGKVIKVNAVTGRITVKAMLTGDPSNAVDWADEDNFGEVIDCVWPMNEPDRVYCDVDNPVVLIPASGDLPFWALFAPVLAPVSAQFCAPPGNLSPGLPSDCDPPAQPGLCETKFACCKSDGSCELLSEAECVAAGGIYNEGVTDCADVDPPCAPLGACCVQGGLCVYTTQSDCELPIAEGGQGGVWAGECTCAEVSLEGCQCP